MRQYIITLWDDGDVTVQPDRFAPSPRAGHHVVHHWAATAVDEFGAAGAVIAELHAELRSAWAQSISHKRT